MADFTFNTAMELTETLKTIPGFPWTLTAVADDLVRWCKGATVDGKTYTPAEQAYWLVTELRDHWERWQGTAGMRQVFVQKFERQKLGPEYQPTPSAAELEVEYGKPDPGWSDRILKIAVSPKDHAAQVHALRYQSIRDCLYFTEGAGRLKTHSSGFWQEGIDRHNKNHPDEVLVIRAAIQRGYLSAEPPIPEYDPDRKDHSLTQSEFEILRAKGASV